MMRGIEENAVVAYCLVKGTRYELHLHLRGFLFLFVLGCHNGVVG